MPLDTESMPVRGQFPNSAEYEAALQLWQVRNTLPVEKIIPPTGGDVKALQVRKPSGAYTHTIPKP